MIVKLFPGSCSQHFERKTLNYESRSTNQQNCYILLAVYFCYNLKYLIKNYHLKPFLLNTKIMNKTSPLGLKAHPVAR